MGAFRVLFVCTGNRFRSALAQECFARACDEVPVEVASAGLLDVDGAPALPEAVALGAEVGLDLTRHAARTLSGADAGSFDLVVGFEPEHVAAAVVEHGAAPERSFTLPELVRLLRAIPVPDGPDPTTAARDALSAAHRLRGDAPTFVPGERLPDPFGKPAGAQQEIAARVMDLTQALAASLFPG